MLSEFMCEATILISLGPSPYFLSDFRSDGKIGSGDIVYWGVAAINFHYVTIHVTSQYEVYEVAQLIVRS